MQKWCIQKKEKVEISLRLISTYTSGEEDEQICLQEFMAERFKKTPDTSSILIGQDSNAQIGRDYIIDDGECKDKCVGFYGL